MLAKMKNVMDLVLVRIKNRINPKKWRKKLETKLICRRAHLSTTVTAAAIAPLKWLLNICIFFHSSSVWYPISSACTRVFQCGKIALALLLVKDNIVGLYWTHDMFNCMQFFFALCCNVTIATVCMRLHRETCSTIVTITTLIKSANERFQLLRMMFSDAKLF